MILEIMAVIIIFIALLLFIFLFIGLKININLNKKGSDLKGIIEVNWAFIKIFSKHFPDKDNVNDKISDENNHKSKNGDNEIDNEDKEEKKSRFNEFKTLIPPLKENFNDIFDFFLVCIKSINLEMFDTNISLGFSSPVDTTTLVGYIWAFSAVPNLSKRFYLSAEPVFTKETVDFDSKIIFKINLLRPFGNLLKLLTKKSILELVWKSKKLFNND